jgi:hypothetical protein
VPGPVLVIFAKLLCHLGVRSCAELSGRCPVHLEFKRSFVDWPRSSPRTSPANRHLSAWIGLVPENDSAGGKLKQRGLSKKGDRYLRSLLVKGAMAVVLQAQKRPDKHPRVAKLLGRMSAKQAAIAIANKTARIAWVLMVRGGVYEAGHRAPQ